MFRFSIRELMLVTALASVIAGWWVDRRAQVTASNEWKDYAGCLERLLKSDGFFILRGKEWVQSTRFSPCYSHVGDVMNLRVGNFDTEEPSAIDTEFVDPSEPTAIMLTTPPVPPSTE